MRCVSDVRTVKEFSIGFGTGVIGTKTIVQNTLGLW